MAVWNIPNYRSQICTTPHVLVTPSLEKNSVMLKWKPSYFLTLKCVANYNNIYIIVWKWLIFKDVLKSQETTEPRLSSDKTGSCLCDGEVPTLCFFCRQSWSRESDCSSVKSSNCHCPQICSFIYCHWRKKKEPGWRCLGFLVSSSGRDLPTVTNLHWSAIVLLSECCLHKKNWSWFPQLHMK